MAATPKWQVGQSVVLKSGGPKMTITRVIPADYGDNVEYACNWFAGKKLDHAKFPEDSLDFVEPEK